MHLRRLGLSFLALITMTAACAANPRPVSKGVSSTSVEHPTSSTAATTVLKTDSTARAISDSTLATPPATVTTTQKSTTPATTNHGSTRSTTVPSTPTSASVGRLGAVVGKVIAIDPGHNGDNWQHTTEMNQLVWIGTQYKACDTAGTTTAAGYTEAAYNLDVGLRLRAVLEAAGAHVVMSRTTNSGWGPCIDERANFGNRAHAAVAISIHADGGPVGGRGYVANMPALVAGYTDGIYVASHRLGVDIGLAFRAGTGMPPSTYFGRDGLVERSDFGGLNLSRVPKILFETGNMKNATDAALLTDSAFRQREAQALAVGLAAFLAGN